MNATSDSSSSPLVQKKKLKLDKKEDRSCIFQESPASQALFSEQSKLKSSMTNGSSVPKIVPSHIDDNDDDGHTTSLPLLNATSDGSSPPLVQKKLKLDKKDDHKSGTTIFAICHVMLSMLRWPREF